MLDKQKLLQSFQNIVGWPYASPGSNSQAGIDCSGAFVYAYKAQDASIYHGSNRIIRVYCQRQMKVSVWGDLRQAMPVFKARADISKMSSQYWPGGKYYNASLPNDYYHVGLITQLEPLTVIHATGPRARQDMLCTRKANESDAAYQGRAVAALIKAGWTWCAWLNAVSYSDNPPGPYDPPPPPPPPVTDEYATVYAANGKPVKMRNEPSTLCRLWWNVEVGERVLIRAEGENGWTAIRYNGRNGYMQSQFLRGD